jgi:sporulation protein YlmC with PRC-barrel domain
MKNYSTYLLPAILLLVAGTSVGACAQVTQTTPNRPVETQRVQLGREGSRALAYFSKMKGANVRNQVNETVTELKDVLFDRYSGDVAAYIVSDDRVVFPSELQANVSDEGDVTLRMDTTTDALKTRIEFDKDALDPDNATSKKFVGWWERFGAESGRRGQIGGQNSDQASVTEKFTNTTLVDVNGVVISTHRVRGENDAYRTVAEVKESGGTLRTVILGPSWYLAEHRALPMRGETVAIKAAPIEEMNGAAWSAAEVKVGNGKRFVLRSGDGLSPTWYGEKNTNQSPDTQTQTMQAQAMQVRTMQRALLLASEVMGDNVKCREVLSGKVDNLVIDFVGGRVAALVIDPNQNFLGISDTTRMIPLSVATVSSDDLIFVDTTKDLIIKAPAAPEKLQTLNTSWNLDSMYEQRETTNRR